MSFIVEFGNNIYFTGAGSYFKKRHKDENIYVLWFYIGDIGNNSVKICEGSNELIIKLMKYIKKEVIEGSKYLDISSIRTMAEFEVLATAFMRGSNKPEEKEK